MIPLRLSMMSLALAPMLIGAAAAVSMEQWQTAGDARHLQRDGERLTLSAAEAATAGIISPAKTAPTGVTAFLASADVTSADAGAITFSVHSGAGGETIGYWQNPLGVAGGRVHAIMPVSKPAGPVRIFIGTHQKPSGATIENVQWEPLRRNMSFSGTMYGALVHGSNSEGQSFRARSKRLAAVRVLARHMKSNEGPDLRVRLYPLKPDAAAPYSSEQPLAEAVIPRQQIPQADQDRQEISVALSAETIPGRNYVVEFSTTAPCEPDGGFLLWGGLGSYPDGCRHQNGTAVKDWDLHLETYDGM